MAKYSEKLMEKVVSLIEQDQYSITDICALLNISRKTFYAWRDTKPEFEVAIAEAMARRDEKLMVKARISLQKKLEGYTLTETKLKYVPDGDNPTQLRLKEKIVKTKEYAPDERAIKLALERYDRKTGNAVENGNNAIHITVMDEGAKRQLEILRDNLLAESKGRTDSGLRLHSKKR